MNHVLLTTNEDYAQHCAVCMVSLLVNNPKSRFTIVVAGLALSSGTKHKLMASVSKYKNVSLEIVDFEERKLDVLPQIGKYSKDIYLRLWISDFFDSAVTKVLYLDVDTIVVDSITELFHMDLGDNLFAAVDIPFSDSHSRCHLPTEYNYFNSGVLLFNLSKWNKYNYLEDVVSFLDKNKDIALNPDQDALNGLFYDSRLTLDFTYNAIGPFFRKGWFEELGKYELSRIRNNVKIVHFNGSRAKPWIYTSNHPYQRKYIEYLSATSWNNITLEETSILNYIKKKLRIWLGLESFVQLKNLKGKAS